MADGGSYKLKDFPIQKYVTAILDGDPELFLPYKSVCDHNENQANKKLESNRTVCLETESAEPSEVKRKGKEIVVCEEPIEHSDERKTSSQNATDSDFEISEDSDNESQNDAAVFELKTAKEHVTTSKKTSVQPAKAKVTTRLGNISRSKNDESVDGADSGKNVNQIKEKEKVLLTQIKKNIEGSRKRRASKINLNKKLKEDIVKKPRCVEAETSKHGEARCKPVVCLALEANKRKAVPVDEPRPVVAKQLIRWPKDHADEIASREVPKGPRLHKPKEPVFSGLLHESVPSGSVKVQKVVKPWKRGAKDHAGENDSLVTAGESNASGSQSVVVRSGDAKNPVKANEQQLDVAKPSNHGPKKLNLQAEGNDCFATGRKVNKGVPLSDSDTGTDTTSYGFGGLLRFEPSGSLAVVRAGQSQKKKVVQTKDIGAGKRRASSSSRSELGGVDEVKELQAADKAIEPDVVKEKNNGPKWHAKCKASGICSGLRNCGPSSASVPVWDQANRRPVDSELMVCQVNNNPADYETDPWFMGNLR